MVMPMQDPEEAAKRLMQEAYQRGSADNITIVVVRFLAEQGGSSHIASAQDDGNFSWLLHKAAHEDRRVVLLYMIVRIEA